MAIPEVPVENHHRVQRFFVLSLAGTLVSWGGYTMSGGFEGVQNTGKTLHETSFGLKKINIEPKDNRGAAVGVTAGTCLAGSGYGVTRVTEIAEGSPSDFIITVRKIGNGTLDAAKVEKCIDSDIAVPTTIHIEQTYP